MAGPLDAFQQLDKRQQVMVVVGIPVAIVAALGYFSWGILVKLGPDPALPSFIQRPGGVWTDINTKIDEIKVQAAIVADGPKVEKDLAALRDDIALAEERLPLAAEKTEVRQLIERLAREVSPGTGKDKKVEFKGVRIVEGGVVKGHDYQSVAYLIDITGDLNGVIKYIDSIEKHRRFMMIRGLSIRPGAQSLDPETSQVVAAPHQVSMEIVTYVYTAGQRKKGK